MIRNGSHMFINGVSGDLLGITMSFDDEVSTSALISGTTMSYDNGNENLWNGFIKLMMILTFN